MEFEIFSNTLLSQINEPSATIAYGKIGIGYQTVLIVESGKIKQIGSFLYRIFREGLANHEKVIRFGAECEKYRIGQRSTEPVWCYKDNKLTFED